MFPPLDFCSISVLKLLEPLLKFFWHDILDIHSSISFVPHHKSHVTHCTPRACSTCYCSQQVGCETHPLSMGERSSSATPPHFLHFFLLFQSDGNTSFLRAARAGNLEKVLEHLKQNIDINTSNAVSIIPLELCVWMHRQLSAFIVYFRADASRQLLLDLFCFIHEIAVPCKLMSYRKNLGASGFILG